MSDGQWAIVELMGHKIVAGLASKDEMLGKPMLRVDVPETKGYPAFTQMYGESAIYCVTFVSEEVARLTAEQCKINPVAVYVPDLVTRQQHESELDELRRHIDVSRRGLASPQVRPDDAGECDQGETFPWRVDESRQRTMDRWIEEDRERMGG
jgi:hypothetical protein